MSPLPPVPPGVSQVTERPTGPLGVLVHPDWVDLPWLVQGTTTRAGPRDLDLGLFSGAHDEAVVRANWRELGATTECATLVHARQVHGADVHVVDEERPSSTDVPRLLEPADGHLTARPGVLLAVTTADCVPVFLVDEATRSVGAVHAGWRGAAAGILEVAVRAMGRAFSTRPEDLRIHLGPAICGTCYEVGPEVFQALLQPEPAGPTPIDVRAVLASGAVGLGVPPARVTISSHCTRCTGSDLYSHRSGDAQRQVGFVGIRERAG